MAGDELELLAERRQRSAFDHAVLAAAGAGWGDIVKMNSYMVNLNTENVAMFRETRSGYLKPGQMPASTLVGVTSLVQPELLLEVEVVAAVGAAAQRAKPKPKAKKKRR